MLQLGRMGRLRDFTMLIYEENPVYGKPFDRSSLYRINATAQALKHFENSLYLTFMQQNGDAKEKRDAGRELSIAAKKIDFWKKMPSFDHDEFVRGCERVKKSWRR